jgi:hypothetical protein
MAFCTDCGSRVVDDARFCSSCGAPVERAQPSTPSATTPPGSVPPGMSPVAAPPPYGGLLGKRHRDRDFRAQVETALVDDILTEAEEKHLFEWAETQGITQKDWQKRFRDLLDRMLIASVNDGRLPDVTSQAQIMLKPGEKVHHVDAASDERGHVAGVPRRLTRSEHPDREGRQVPHRLISRKERRCW